MTRYTELRHAGYYQDDLSEADRKKIEKEVDSGKPRTEAPAESTVFDAADGGTKASTKKS